MSELCKLVNYTTKESVSNTLIQEYDISKANINILLYKGLLTRERYEYLFNLPKKIREITVGLMQKNTLYRDAIKEGIIEFKEKFFKENNIKDSDIISIKNDAVFIKGIKPLKTKFYNVEFVLKNEYTTFMNIDGIEIYYNINTGIIDLKGISGDRIELHKFFIDSIKNIVEFASLNAYDDCFFYIRDLYNKLCNKELPIEYYREFNPLSEFLIDSRNTYMGYKLNYKSLPEDYKRYMNISANEKFLRELSIVCIRLFLKNNPHRQ